MSRNPLFALPAILVLAGLPALPLLAGEAPDRAATPGGSHVFFEVLPNGLTVVIKENHTAQVIALRAYVKNTGRIYEEEFCGCGIAHNVEHLVCGGTTSKRTEDESEEMLKSFGGHANAYTSMDHTCYLINAASDSFDPALDMLSDWLMNCAFKPEEVARERETITEEINRANDNWMRAGHQMFYRALFPDHPICVPTLGYLNQFRSLTREDLVGYFRERYIPRNVVFVVVGDVKTGEAFAKIRKAFSSWPRGREKKFALPAPRPTTGLKWVEDSHPAARTCRIYMGFHSIDLAHPDLYALDVLALVLGHGRASRISSRIVEKERLAAVAGAYSLTPSYGCGVFTVYLLGMPYKNVRPAVEAVLAEIERGKVETVGKEELERAKTQCIADHVFRCQTMEDQAEDLGGNVMGMNDPYFSERYIEGIRKVKAEELLAVARRYLDRSKLTVAVIHPKGAGAAKAAVAETAAGVEGETIKMTLKSGLRVLIQRNTSSPIVTLQAWCRAGLGAEPEGKNGINNLTAALLTQGTATRSQMEIHRLLEGIGGKVDASGGNNTYGIKIEVLREGLDKAFDLFADILRNPSFPAPEVEKAKFQTIQAIMRKKADAEEELIKVYRSRYFREHPYRRIQEGTPKEIKAITRDDLAAYHRRWCVPTNIVVAVAGDLTVQEAKTLVEKYFNDMVQPEGFKPVEVPVEPPREEPETVEVESDFGNVLLVVGFPAPQMTDEDRFALTLMNRVVSAGEGNWVFEALRGREEGLVYSAWGSFWPGLGASTYYIAALTSQQKTGRVLELIFEQIEKAKGGVSEKELEQAKRACVVGELIYRQTLSGQAQWAALSELYGMGYDFPKRYLNKIKAVTLDDVKRVANRYLQNPMVLKVVPRTKEKPKGE